MVSVGIRIHLILLDARRSFVFVTQPACLLCGMVLCVNLTSKQS